MRTKALLLAAAFSAAGIASSMAQANVYSLNVVGYNNLTLTNGFNLVANQLDLDGTGVNNTIYTTLGTNVPNATRAYAFSGGGFVFTTFNAGTLTWIGSGLAAVNTALQPGGGVFVSIPAAASYPQTVTLVGNVMQGALNTPIAAAYQLVSSKVPQLGLMKTDLGFTPVSTDKVYQFLAGSQTYGGAHTYNAGTGTWLGGEPSLAVGESVFLLGHAGSTWSRNFTVP